MIIIIIKEVKTLEIIEKVNQLKEEPKNVKEQYEHLDKCHNHDLENEKEEV